jgi:hypothetical protein
MGKKPASKLKHLSWNNVRIAAYYDKAKQVENRAHCQNGTYFFKKIYRLKYGSGN